MSVSGFLSNSVLVFALGMSILIPVAVAILSIFKVIIAAIAQHRRIKKAQELASVVRPGRPGQPNFVRHDDVVQLNSHQLKLKSRAAQLIEEGNPKEAAQIYRQLTLDRLAIQTLEDAGLIKEACQVLFDKQLPNRAGTLCERNGYLLEAAECFKVAKMHLEEGNVYVKAAAKDYRLYRNAAEAYESGNLFREAVSAYETILDFQMALRLCLKQGDGARVLDLALNPRFPLALLQGLEDEVRVRILDQIAVNPKSAQDLGHLVGRLDGFIDLRIIGKKFGTDGSLYRILCDAAGKSAVSLLVEKLEVKEDPWEKESWKKFSEVLTEKSFVAEAALVCEKNGDQAAAIRCYLSLGNLDKVNAILRLIGSEGSVQEIAEIVKRYQQALGTPHGQEAVKSFWDGVNGVLKAIETKSR